MLRHLNHGAADGSKKDSKRRDQLILFFKLRVDKIDPETRKAYKDLQRNNKCGNSSKTRMLRPRKQLLTLCLHPYTAKG
jgi:hypothetical protein